MPFVPLLALGSLVFTLINWLKALTNRDWPGATTQAIAWVAGIVAVVLVAHTDYAAGVVFGDRALDQLNGASLVFIGLSAASLLGVVNEVKKAVDNHDTAAQPPLFGPDTEGQ